ncbi:hypothetical protein V8F20_008787 [Naviculisporaceae sp. PSN 640]
MGPTRKTTIKPVAPSGSLPALRVGASDQLTETRILAALDNLFAIYYPLSPATIPNSVIVEAAAKPFKLPAISRVAASLQTPDSGYSSPGYVSENEDDDDDDDENNDLELLRADEFERSFATRWLEKFMIRAEDEGDEVFAGAFESEESRQSVVERAADLLTALLNPEELFQPPAASGDRNGDEDDVFCRELKFDVQDSGVGSSCENITIKINDGLAGSSSSDHLDVGVQTWGASIVMGQLMCDAPSRFGLSHEQLADAPRIVELGAGTGVVSLILAQLLPRYLNVKDPVIVATDYHPVVMANLRRNISINEDSDPRAEFAHVHACTLDWAKIDLLQQAQDWPLDMIGGFDGIADMLIATDVVYAKEHAALLRDCAARLLAPSGTFWLLQTVRSNGRLGEYEDAVESAFPMFTAGHGENNREPSLKILEEERLEKRTGIGRGDETFYRLFRIGWA